MKILQDKVVLITGASAGIGRETALAFAREKAKVAVCARRADLLRSLESEIRAIGGECLYSIVDVSDRTQLDGFVQNIVDRWGRLDVAVCNAGFGYLAKVEEIDAQEMERIWRVNYMGTLFTIQASLPFLKAQKESNIVIVSSVVGRYALPMSGGYCVTKFAQVGLAQSLRVELKPAHCAVTVVYPGRTETEFGTAQLNPMNRPGTLASKAQPASEVAKKMVSAVKKNKKEIYPNFPGSLFCHFGMYFPSLMDSLMGMAASRIRRA